MNIDRFVVLDAVVRTGSFSAAAKELNRVQSAVSYAIKTLEDELGVPLFSRETYRPSLTVAGEAVLRKARRLLASVREIELLSLHLTRGHEAMVRFDITPTCRVAAITPILKTVAELFPETRLKITMEVFGGESLVLEGLVDLSLTDLLQPDDRLETVPWQKIAFLPVVAPNHPLAALEPEHISHPVLLKHTQIVVRSSSHLTQTRSMGVIEGAQTWTVNDFPTKRTLILSGLGWGNMPDYMIKKDLEHGTLVRIQSVDIPDQIARLYLVRKRWETHGPVASHLWNQLVELAKKA